MKHWNAPVMMEECTSVETGFLTFSESKRRGRIQQISIDCTNGKRYFIDNVSIDKELRNKLSMIEENESIFLLIHPNRNTIVDFSTKSESLFTFKDTIKRLEKEADAFFYLGIFMYIFSFIGLGYTVFYFNRKRKYKKHDKDKGDKNETYYGK